MPATPATTVELDGWATYEPSDETPWNHERVVHLHRRAGFAATWSAIERDLADGPRRAIDRLLGDGAVEPEFEGMARTIGDAAVASGNPNRLKAWWLYRMLFSPDPLGERLTLMWHNHFATSNRKVQDLALMREQNELFRHHARAPFGDILHAVVKHPAMLAWLDADANRKEHPNENLARELMELFTLGIGNYNESDVQAAARALTGWGIIDGRFGFREARHDTSDKLFLGEDGPLDGDALLERLLEQTATAERLAGRICGLFFGESVVTDQQRRSLAEGLLRSRELDIAWAVETVLRSQLFFAEANLRSRIAGPVEWLVGAVRALELSVPPPSTLLLAEWTTRAGQDLFYPPNVGGWPDGRAWLSSQSVVARANFAVTLVQGRVWHPSQAPDLWQLVRRHRGTDDLTEAVAWIAELLWGIAPPQAIANVLSAVNDEAADRRLSTAVAFMLARAENQLM